MKERHKGRLKAMLPGQAPTAMQLSEASRHPVNTTSTERWRWKCKTSDDCRCKKSQPTQTPATLAMFKMTATKALAPVSRSALM